MLSQQIEEKKKRNNFQSAVGNLERVVNESQASIRREKPNVPLQQTTQTQTPVRNKSIKDYSIMSPDRQSNGIEADDKSSFDGKKFKSRYIDNDGLWTRESVDDGYVEFKDYIKDRRDGVDFGVSFNDKEFKPRRANYGDISYNNEEYEPIAYDYSEVQSSESNELYPYTIAENLGETAGVGDFIKGVGKSAWNFADKALEFGGNKVSTAIQSVLKYAKQSPYYDMVVEDVRDIWRWGANILRGDRFKCYSSAWLLEYALQDNPRDQYRGNNSRIAWLVNTDPNYLSALDAAIKKI